MTTQPLPSTHRALVLTSRGEAPSVQQLPTPQPGPGSVLLRVLASGVLSYSNEVFTGKRPYPFPTYVFPLDLLAVDVNRRC